ncbi:MAG TPA: phosphotransferase, partial [Thermomicrobiales bacterium]|nr:phosphotransferase [Thermomicrobiales bacterium]
PVHACYITPDAGRSLLDTTRDAFRALSSDPGYARAVAIHDLTHDLLQRLERAWAGYARSLPRHLIHGDFVGNNVLIHQGEVIAILDFDRLAVRHRVYDAAYTLMYVVTRLHRTGQRTPAADDGLTAGDLDRLVRVLAGYVASSHDELSDEEIAALPYEMARAILYPAVTAGQDLRHAIAETLDFGGHVPLCLWLVEHADVVSARLREAVDRRGAAG